MKEGGALKKWIPHLRAAWQHEVGMSDDLARSP